MEIYRIDRLGIELKALLALIYHSNSFYPSSDFLREPFGKHIDCIYKLVKRGRSARAKIY
jgi:hypothetical protein